MTKPTHQPRGRPPGVKSRKTIAREILAAKAVDAAIANAKKLKGKDAAEEITRATMIAEGICSKLRPESIQIVNGVVSVMGGDIDLFGKWFDRWFECIQVLARYQLAPIAAIQKPTEAPKSGDNVISFGLRVFESGKPVEHLQPYDDVDDEDDPAA